MVKAKNVGIGECFPVRACAFEQHAGTDDIGIDKISKRILLLTDFLQEELTKLNCEIYSPRKYEDEKYGILSFCIPHHSSEDIIQKLKEKNIYLNLRRD